MGVGGDGGVGGGVEGGVRGVSFNDFRFRTFIGHFPSDGAASLAVKGLIVCAVFPCVPTMPVFGIFAHRYNADNCTRGLYGQRKT